MFYTKLKTFIPRCTNAANERMQLIIYKHVNCRDAYRTKMTIDVRVYYQIKNVQTLCLNKIKLNKSPGSDGVSAEFNKMFWYKIGPVGLDYLNESQENDELSESQKFGIVSLIYKKNDPLYRKHWRPIYLLNMDYKIAAYALAVRNHYILPFHVEIWSRVSSFTSDNLCLLVK